MSNANSPAYPDPMVPIGHGEYTGVQSPGLTKREAFAMAAMQGLLADPDYNLSPGDSANHCVHYADALLAALEVKDE